MKTREQLKAEHKEEKRKYTDSKVAPWLERFRRQAESSLICAKVGKDVLLFKDGVTYTPPMGTDSKPELKEKEYIRLAIVKLNQELKKAKYPWQAVLNEGKEEFEGNLAGYGGRDEWVYPLEIILKPCA